MIANQGFSKEVLDDITFHHNYTFPLLTAKYWILKFFSHMHDKRTGHKTYDEICHAREQLQKHEATGANIFWQEVLRRQSIVANSSLPTNHPNDSWVVSDNFRYSFTLLLIRKISCNGTTCIRSASVQRRLFDFQCVNHALADLVSGVKYNREHIVSNSLSDK